MRAHQQGISPRLRGPHTRRRIRKDLHPRSSVARRESSCPLDKDLSWKSPNRKLTHCPAKYCANCSNRRGVKSHREKRRHETTRVDQGKRERCDGSAGGAVYDEQNLDSGGEIGLRV